ncbi:MAG: SpoIIE family protein phosphatase, partial [Acidobacteriota bacterium]
FGGFSLKVSGTRISGGALVNLILYDLAIAIVFIFGLYRFVQRARQRELSFQRIALLTGVIAILFMSIILLTDIATFNNALQSSWVWPVFVFGGLSYVFMGLVVAAGYGSGEGDLREAYPGKLNSLDALLVGRIFSRNVARSVVVGVAFAAWALLLTNLVPYFWRNQPAAGSQIEVLDFIVGRVPWLTPSVIWPFDVVFTSIIGLLLPLPFVRRRLRNPKLILTFVAIFAWIACTGTASSFTPWAGAALIGALRAASMLVPFFKFDLLTALVSLAVPTFATASTHLVAQPSAPLRQAGLISLGLGLAFVTIEMYFAYRGRLVREDEIGPQYAKLLAERLSLQAEVSAAREAQIRLLPQSLPQSPEFSIAAECRPAHEVGGDFYEVFPLDDDRVGIFMAEGGGKGLASALAIAFAKGFLMPKISGAGQGDDSPTEIVRSLQSRLKQTLDEDDRMGFAYAIIDYSDRTLRYARTGVSPRLVIGKPPIGNVARELGTLPEMETTFSTPARVAGDVTRTFSVLSGMGEVSEGDCIVMFTDGIESALTEEHSSAAQNLWRILSSEDLTLDGRLQKSLHGAIDATSKRAHKAGITDDLTVLVVRINPQTTDGLTAPAS